jgi:hypothetical protein
VVKLRTIHKNAKPPIVLFNRLGHMDKMERPLLAASARMSEITVTAQKTSAKTKAKSRATRWVPANDVTAVAAEAERKKELLADRAN